MDNNKPDKPAAGRAESDIVRNLDGSPMMMGGKVVYYDQIEGTSDAVKEAAEKWFETADLTKYGIDPSKIKR